MSEQEKDQNEADVREEQDDAEVEAHMPARRGGGRNEEAPEQPDEIDQSDNAEVEAHMGIRRGGGRNEEAPEQPDEIDQSDEDDEPDVEAHGGVRAF